MAFALIREPRGAGHHARSPVGYHRLGRSAPREHQRWTYETRHRRVAVIGSVAITYTRRGRSWIHDTHRYGAVPWTLWVEMRATTGTVHARLYDDTVGDVVAGSAVSTASATHVILTAGPLRLIHAHQYHAETGRLVAAAGFLRGIDLVRA